MSNATIERVTPDTIKGQFLKGDPLTEALESLAITKREGHDTTTDEFLTIVAGEDSAEYAPGRINNGRQASFDAVSAWNAVGRID